MNKAQIDEIKSACYAVLPLFVMNYAKSFVKNKIQEFLPENIHLNNIECLKQLHELGEFFKNLNSITSRIDRRVFWLEKKLLSQLKNLSNQIFLACADNGHVVSQVKIAYNYSLNRHQKESLKRIKDDELSFHYYKLAAEKGNELAIRKVLIGFYCGLGVKISNEMAIFYFEKLVKSKLYFMTKFSFNIDGYGFIPAELTALKKSIFKNRIYPASIRFFKKLPNDISLSIAEYLDTKSGLNLTLIR